MSCPPSTKIFDAYKTLPKDKRDNSNAAIGVAYCDKLFMLERQFGPVSDMRLKEREHLSKPVFIEFYNWVDSLQVYLSPSLGQLSVMQNLRKNISKGIYSTVALKFQIIVQNVVLKH